MSGTALMFVVMFALLFIGVPIGVSMFVGIFALIAVNPVTNMSYLMQTIYSGTADFSYLSLPFFMVCGTLMEGGGISKRLVAIANSVVGGVTGSLGMVTILACMMFGAVSGSAPATVAAIGAIMIPQMVRNGYSKYYAAALCATAGSLGVIVPPSYPMVLYAVTLNNCSITDLFLGGLGPALVVGGTLMVINYFYCRSKGLRGDIKISFKGFAKAIKDGFWALLMPVIILGGIYSGVFSATESAVIATVYGLIVGKFVYKELTVKRAWTEFRDIAVYMGGTMFCLAPCKALGSVFAYLQINETIKAFLYGISTNPNVILFFVFIILFIAGMFIQTTPCIIILGPTLWAVVSGVGINPVHFGLVMVLALSIAFVTPPVAVNLFVASSLTGIDIMRITKHNWRFLIGLIFAFFLIAFVPQISTFLIG